MLPLLVVHESQPYNLNPAFVILHRVGGWEKGEYLWFIYLFTKITLKKKIRGTPVAYGSSQAKGLIGTATASVHHSHSNVESEPHL